MSRLAAPPAKPLDFRPRPHFEDVRVDSHIKESGEKSPCTPQKQHQSGSSAPLLPSSLPSISEGEETFNTCEGEGAAVPRPRTPCEPAAGNNSNGSPRRRTTMASLDRTLSPDQAVATDAGVVAVPPLVELFVTDEEGFASQLPPGRETSTDTNDHGDDDDAPARSCTMPNFNSQPNDDIIQKPSVNGGSVFDRVPPPPHGPLNIVVENGRSSTEDPVLGEEGLVDMMMSQEGEPSQPSPTNLRRHSHRSIVAHLRRGSQHNFMARSSRHFTVVSNSSFDNGSMALHSASVASMPRGPVVRTDHASVDSESAFDDGAFRVNQYVLVHLLGRGRQGEVFLAEDSDTGELRAVKVVRRPRTFGGANGRFGVRGGDTNGGGALNMARAQRHHQLQAEIDALTRCRHRNIVMLHEVIDDPQHDTMYLVMQFVRNGPLAATSGCGTVDEPIEPLKLLLYARQLAAGLSYLHSRDIVHRDIKPDNVLVGDDGVVYLADFGMAALMRDDGETVEHAALRGGTLPFMSPELLDPSAYEEEPPSTGQAQPTTGAAPLSRIELAKAADVWALGITFYALLFGRVPWNLSRPVAHVVDEITRGIGPIPPLYIDPAAVEQGHAYNLFRGPSAVTSPVKPGESPSHFHQNQHDSPLSRTSAVLGSPLGFSPPASPPRISPTTLLGPVRPWNPSDAALKCSEKLRLLLSRMLDVDPRKRLRADCVREHVSRICTIVGGGSSGSGGSNSGSRITTPFALRNRHVFEPLPQSSADVVLPRRPLHDTS